VISLRHITAALVALATLAVAAPAAQAGWRDVVRECYNTGDLKGDYSKEELKEARRNLPSDIREYSDCEDLINAALAAAAKNGGRSGGNAGGAFPANPALTTPSGAIAADQEDFDALGRATDPDTRPTAPPEVQVADQKITPTTGGLLGAARNAESNSLPVPLILSLVVLAAMAAVGALAVMRQRSPQIRAALRIFRR
jgi:hypothetical protein